MERLIGMDMDDIIEELGEPKDMAICHPPPPPWGSTKAETDKYYETFTEWILFYPEYRIGVNSRGKAFWVKPRVPGDRPGKKGTN